MFVIYWEKTPIERGFVSYDNNHLFERDEYNPVGFYRATQYKTLKAALHTKNWYNTRGMGDFFVLEVH